MSEKLKVAAYARISMDSMQMQHSLHAQMTYYQKLIENKQEWEYTGIYADEGLSGTSLKKRLGFQRMMKDCEKGKIDRILVKSVSRFSRNTVDLLKIIRHLKSKNISVYFEEQKIDTLSEEGELMLTIMAAVAQAESENISENAKWAIRRSFQKGIPNTKRRTFGYQWMDGKMIVVPEEATVVRQIFQNFLAGKSHKKTMEELNEKGIRSVKGGRIGVSSISFILRNFTYTGNMLLQKTYISDPVSKKKMLNTGELPQYLVWNDHEAIIDMATFQAVQERLEQNKREGRFPYNRTGKVYPFTGKIICGKCGCHYTRQLWHTGRKGEKRASWVCTGKLGGKDVKCGAENISEEKLMRIAAEAIDKERFDEEVFGKRVDNIKIYNGGKMIFCMKNGKSRMFKKFLQH